MQQLLPLVQAQAWPFTAIISHRMPLQQGVEAYKMFAEVTCYYVTSCMLYYAAPGRAMPSLRQTWLLVLPAAVICCSQCV